MRSRHLLAVAVGLALACSLVLASGAPARTATRAHVAAASSPLRYLRSLGIDPRTVVVQRGRRNYAGPKCPGKGWNCTRATRVLQVGGTNSVACTPGTGSIVGATQSCTIVQVGPGANTANCTERSTSAAAVQDCNISQMGTQNAVTVLQAVDVGSGLTQRATQTVEIVQDSTGAGNALGVVQHVGQSVAARGAQTQDAFQEVTANQTAASGSSGSNVSGIAQDQSQAAYNGTAQAQNTSASGIAPCPAASLFGLAGSDPNQCAFVAQTADSGNNLNGLFQKLGENESSKVATLQHQGMPEGGINGQAELTSASGSSQDFAKQSKSQTAQGPAGADQQQIDPMGCCGLSASGNAASQETLDQSSTQHASTGAAATQQLAIFGFVHTPLGGSCSITQSASDNADSSSESLSTPTCSSGLGIETDCTNGTEGGCTADTEFNPSSIIELRRR